MRVIRTLNFCGNLYSGSLQSVRVVASLYSSRTTLAVPSDMSANGASPTSPRRPSHSPTLLRKGIPGERKPLKEKLVTYYEQLFKVR